MTSTSNVLSAEKYKPLLNASYMGGEESSVVSTPTFYCVNHRHGPLLLKQDGMMYLRHHSCAKGGMSAVILIFKIFLIIFDIRNAI